MKIILHFPSAKEDMAELENRVATVHADAAIRYIKNLSCPADQKVGLLRALVKTSRLVALPNLNCDPCFFEL